MCCGVLGALLLSACEGEAPPQSITPEPSVSIAPAAPAPIPAAFGAVPPAWTLTGSHSFYARLYDSSLASLHSSQLLEGDIPESPAADTDGDGEISLQEESATHAIPDRIITAVAADLVAQYYYRGTKPLEERGNDLVVWRTNDMAPIPTEEFALKNAAGDTFDLNEVKLFVHEAMFNPNMGQTCELFRPWWNDPDEPTNLPDSETYIITPFQCIQFIDEIRSAVDRERRLHALRQDLSLIAYGGEFLWDGQLQISPTELRSYDLLADLAGVSNILGGAPYAALFESGNQGEQCDGELCACVYGSTATCGDGIKQGGAEQCDDGNRFPGDGCDAFCQVEQNYCGDDEAQHWEECSEKRECPDGSQCSDYTDCAFGGNAPCAFDDNELERCTGLVWKKTCRYTGFDCTNDAACPPPFFVPPELSQNWQKDSCRYTSDGVCWIGGVGKGIIHGRSCRDQGDCSDISTCTSEGFCTNHPYRSCTSDTQCYSCSNEEIKGTCYESGKECNGNEDCAVTEYCILEPEDICRPRLLGGLADRRSTCNGYCEENTRCGDRTIYLTESGAIEECDDGMHCADGATCYLGQICKDGSVCMARDGGGGVAEIPSSCTAKCLLQICGDGITANQPPEECDDGAACDDGTPCSLTAPSVCTQIDKRYSCQPRGGDGCSAGCMKEGCGDRIQDIDGKDNIPKNADDEECDNGGFCSNGSVCATTNGCPTFPHCKGTWNNCTNDFDCLRGSRCLPGNTSSVCTVQNNDGCTTQCKREFCGDGVLDGNGLDNISGNADDEACDDGNAVFTDACVGCKNAFCGDHFVWEGNEECDGNYFVGGYTCSAACIVVPPSPTTGCENVSCGNGCLDYGDASTASVNEECDDGNTTDGDGCSGSCKSEYCGDGVPDSNGPDNVNDTADDEVCDDGGSCFAGMNASPTGPCGVRDPEACAEVPSVCSNGGGACFGPGDCTGGTCAMANPACTQNNCDACDNGCKEVKCGNGVRQCSEECDDGNTANNDGCSSKCLLEFCGDGNLNTAGADNIQNTPDDEECDAAWTNSNTLPDACRLNCKNAHCGDGVVDPMIGEECDVPTCPNGALCKTQNDCGGYWCMARGGFGCSAQCKKEFCGDSVVQETYGEECDDGNTVSSDGCSGACRNEVSFCGNEVTDPEGTDRFPGTEDDEECDYSETTAGSCPDATGGSGLMGCDAYGSDNILGTDDDEICDLGTCDIATRRCSDGSGFVCLTDDDCKAQCVPTCTPHCKIRAMPCGDSYRDPGEQCDDGNAVNGDGCSAPTCRLERPDLCGNGKLDPGEQCDQMHPYSTIECTLFCQFPHEVPECGDGRKDPSGAARGDLLAEVLSFSEGYRLDGRWSSGRETVPNWAGDNGQYSEGGGWYVTPRVFGENFNQVLVSGKQDLKAKLDGPGSCSLCGNGALNEGEQCDSGRLSGGSYPEKRYNAIGWKRLRESLTYATQTLPNFWKWYAGLYPFGFYTFDAVWQQWYLTGNWYSLQQIRGYHSYDYYGGWYGVDWWLSDRKTAEERVFLVDSCSASCTLARCGDDRIDDGETCDDDNSMKFLMPPAHLGPQDGDGCSSTCMLEAGFSFSAGSIEWPGGPQRPVCGDDVISITEQCDDGGVCQRRDGLNTKKYCRREPGRTFCDPDGIDDKFPSPDDEIDCVPVADVSEQDICDENCQIEPVGICGNGELEPYEECDDGTKNGANAACNLQCRKKITPPSNPNTPYCGDGAVQHGEECDDGNTALLDGCTHCLVDLCGNNLLDAGEHCDDGNRTAGDGCSAWCIKENVCGNGLLDGVESCDDGNDFDDDGCSALCKFEFCGDGVPQPGLGEECDEGLQNSVGPSALCRPDCMLPRCGDRSIDSVIVGTHLGKDILYAEICDPGMHCKNTPAKECADDWQCPIGPCDAASGSCAGASWIRCEKDGDCGYDTCIIQDEIDPVTKKVLCSAQCTQPVLCGDGHVQGDEECDHKKGGCIACKLDRLDLCGNGKFDAAAGEQCDDGNRAGNDGCSATCQYEESACPGSCFLAFECSAESVFSGEVCSPDIVGECPGGACVMRTECAGSCVFGFCGNGTVDPGEQCDDGRHCLHNPSKPCSTNVDCGAGSCTGADPTNRIAGTCADEPERSCMTGSDCQSLCLPLGEDGCTSACRHEVTPKGKLSQASAAIILCQEEVSRIGADQIDEWQETLLDPEGNPFLGWQNGGWWSWYWDFHQWNLISRFGWSGFWTWYGGGMFGTNCRAEPQKCLAQFPNSVGLLVQAVTGSFGWVAQHRTMPDRMALMPFEPVGVVSYPACQELRPELASAVEIPAQPPVSIPPYEPSMLVRNIERYLCEEGGFPRRNFPFLCLSESSGLLGGIAPSPEYASAARLREMVLRNTLAIGYRSGERALGEYLSEAVQALAQSLETAVRLFTNLERVEFATEECPLDDSVLCVP